MAQFSACLNRVPRRKGREEGGAAARRAPVYHTGNINFERQLLHCAREDLNRASLDFQTKLNVEAIREVKLH